MITYANYFKATRNNDDSFNIEFFCGDKDKHVATIYMTKENAEALSNLIKQVLEKKAQLQ